MSVMLSQIGQQGAVLAFGDAYRIVCMAAGAAFSCVLPALLQGRMTADPNAAPVAH
jgi:hypothetical protein